MKSSNMFNLFVREVSRLGLLSSYMIWNAQQESAQYFEDQTFIGLWVCVMSLNYLCWWSPALSVSLGVSHWISFSSPLFLINSFTYLFVFHVNFWLPLFVYVYFLAYVQSAFICCLQHSGLMFLVLCFLFVFLSFSFPLFCGKFCAVLRQW